MVSYNDNDIFVTLYINYVIFHIAGGDFSSHMDSHKLEKTLTQQLCELPDIDKKGANMITSPANYRLEASSRSCKQKSSQSSTGTKGTSRDSGSAQFIGDFQNDGESGDFDSLNYDHSREMMNVSEF